MNLVSTEHAGRRDPSTKNHFETSSKDGRRPDVSDRELDPASLDRLRSALRTALDID
jgi:hypothetical protein